MAASRIDELLAVLESGLRQDGGMRENSPAATPVRPEANLPNPDASTGAVPLLNALPAESAPNTGGDLGRLSSELELLRRAAQQQTDTLAGNTQALVDSVLSKAGGAASAAGSSATDVLAKTLGSLFGIGPIVSGVMSLFGLGGDDTPAPLATFSLPQAIKQDAGLERDNSFAPLTYGDSGIAKSVPVQSAPAPQITVQVQAVDSQSFMDRSDDIARAVKEAMLHSHSLNDVVVDL